MNYWESFPDAISGSLSSSILFIIFVYFLLLSASSFQLITSCGRDILLLQIIFPVPCFHLLIFLALLNLLLFFFRILNLLETLFSDTDDVLGLSSTLSSLPIYVGGSSNIWIGPTD